MKVIVTRCLLVSVAILFVSGCVSLISTMPPPPKIQYVDRVSPDMPESGFIEFYASDGNTLGLWGTIKEVKGTNYFHEGWMYNDCRIRGAYTPGTHRFLVLSGYDSVSPGPGGWKAGDTPDNGEVAMALWMASRGVNRISMVPVVVKVDQGMVTPVRLTYAELSREGNERKWRMTANVDKPLADTNYPTITGSATAPTGSNNIRAKGQTSSTAEALNQIRPPSATRKPTSGTPWTIPDLGIQFVWMSNLNCWAGKYEVSNAEYRKFKPNHVATRFEWKAFGVQETPIGKVQGLSIDEPDQPSVVRFPEAEAFCSWLNAREKAAGRLIDGYTYRLPSDDEWTLLAQCGDARAYPWGNEWPPTQGNYCDETYGKAFDDNRIIHGYNDKQPVSCVVSVSGCNSWGLYGLGGNVWEWTSYPQNPDRWQKYTRNLRGGSWNSQYPNQISATNFPFDVPIAELYPDNIDFALKNDPHKFDFVWDDVGFRIMLAKEPHYAPTQRVPAVATIKDKSGDVSARIAPISDPTMLAKFAIEDTNWEVRIAAVKKIADQKVLAKVVLEDPNSSVRYDAAGRVTDQTVLAKVAVEDKHAPVRAVALGRITDQTLRATVLDSELRRGERIGLIDKITGQSLLGRIAFEAQDHRDREQAIGRITDQALLAKLAFEAKLSQERRAAVMRLTDQTVVAKVLSDDRQDSGIRWQAVIRLTNQEALAAAAMVDKSPDICREAVKRLTDPPLLRKVAESAENSEVRDIARAKANAK